MMFDFYIAARLKTKKVKSIFLLNSERDDSSSMLKEFLSK